MIYFPSPFLRIHVFRAHDLTEQLAIVTHLSGPISPQFLHLDLCYAMLCYAMLCYAMLCHAMLCYAMLCYAVLCHAILFSPLLYSVMPPLHCLIIRIFSLSYIDFEIDCISSQSFFLTPFFLSFFFFLPSSLSSFFLSSFFFLLSTFFFLLSSFFFLLFFFLLSSFFFPFYLSFFFLLSSFFFLPFSFLLPSIYLSSFFLLLQNGLRFISNKGEILDIMYGNIKHAIYQPCDKTTMVLVHFHLKVLTMLVFAMIILKQLPSCHILLL